MKNTMLCISCHEACYEVCLPSKIFSNIVSLSPFSLSNTYTNNSQYQLVNTIQLYIHLLDANCNDFFDDEMNGEQWLFKKKFYFTFSTFLLPQQQHGWGSVKGLKKFLIFSNRWPLFQINRNTKQQHQ